MIQILSALWLITLGTPESFAQGCWCPPGFEVGLGGKICSKKVSVNPNQVPNPTDVVVGDWDHDLLSYPFYNVETSGNTNWPFTAQTFNYPVKDAGAVVMPGVNFPRTQPWVDKAAPSSSTIIKGNREDWWFSKTFCLGIPESRHYVMFVGGDNNYKVRIDGKDYAQCVTDYCFRTGLFLGQELYAGNHFIEIKYRNFGGPGSLWFEVYQNSNAEIQTNPPANLNRLFSTQSLVGSKWDYSSPSGEICPGGYTFDSCESRLCVKWENIKCALNVHAEDSFCGQPHKVTFHNTTDYNVSALWTLYKLRPDGTRITPSLAVTVQGYNIGQSWTGTLQELFVGQNFAGQMLTNGEKFELTAGVNSMTGPEHWDYTSTFTVKEIPTGINVTNDPDHPDPNPIDPNYVGDFAIFDKQGIDFRLKVLEAGLPDPISVNWTLPGGNPSGGTGQTISSVWNGPSPQGGVQLVADSRFANGCVSKAKAKLIISDGRGPSVPTAFTPDNDGLNDTFQPLGLNIDWQSFIIWNRWGQIVYQHRGGGQPKPWDGKMRVINGGYDESVQQGSFVFVVTGEWRHMGDQGSKYRRYKGFVTLIR